MKEQILEIIKDESEKAGVRKHTCINGFGYSMFERNIADRVEKLAREQFPWWVFMCGWIIGASLALIITL